MSDDILNLRKRTPEEIEKKMMEFIVENVLLKKQIRNANKI
jgi:hypothetical protein